MMQRIFAVSALKTVLVACFLFTRTLPHEPKCGPFDSYQSPGGMLFGFSLKASFVIVLEDIVLFLDSSWSVILSVMTMVMLLLCLRVQVSRYTNRQIIEQMALTSQRHVMSLRKEIWRLEQQGELLKRRLGWMESD